MHSQSRRHGTQDRGPRAEHTRSELPLASPPLPPHPAGTIIFPMIPGPPPFLEHYLLEDPWPLAGLLAVVAFLVFIVGRRGTPRAQRITFFITLGLIAAAAGVYTLASLVTTTREQLEKETRGLVALTAPMQVPALRVRFVPGTPILDRSGNVMFDSEALFQQLESGAMNVSIRQQTILALMAQADNPTRGTVFVRLRTNAGYGGMEAPVTSEWLLDWTRGADGQWRISGVRNLRLGDNSSGSGMVP
jgi:hypothetical protein